MQLKCTERVRHEGDLYECVRVSVINCCIIEQCTSAQAGPYVRFIHRYCGYSISNFLQEKDCFIVIVERADSLRNRC